MLLRAVAMFALALFGAAESANAQGADTTLVNTPSNGANPPGSLVNGNLVKAAGPHGVIDSGIAGANVDLLNASQSVTALKTFSGGLALPSGSNPSGSCCYVDTSGNLHFVSSFMDAQLVGGKFAGDSSRPWFPAIGSGVTETSSGQIPNLQINRNDKFSGGSGLQFALRSIYTSGNGFTEKTTAPAPSGTSTIMLSANPNFATGQSVYGACIPSGTTISSYAAGTVGLSNPLACNVDVGVEVSACGSSCAPTNQPVGIESELDQYSNQISTVAAPNALEGFLFKWVPSTSISEAANIVCRDWTGRKSSIAGPCIGAEVDTLAAGPDDNADRYILELTGAEGEPSADGATDIWAAIRIRPQTAESQPTPNPITFDNGVLVTTMPGGAAAGVYGNFVHGFNCGGGETTGCHDAVSETLTHLTSALAASGQNQIQFALATSINAGQAISGSINIPAGTTVSAVYQCNQINQLPGCGSVANATLVVLSANLTGNIAGGTALTFVGTLNDGSNFNAYFTDAFANWTNQNGTGWLKAGTANNSGTVFDIRGFGADSTNTTGIDYGDLIFAIDTNAHGSTLGHIGVTNAGFEVGSPTGGNCGMGCINAQSVEQQGSALGTFAFQNFATPPPIGSGTPAAGSFVTLTNTGHVVSNGTAQSCSNIVFGTGAGTGPACNSITGDDHKFNINFSTGTSPGTSAALWTLAFNGGSYSAAPNCLFSAVGGNTAASITKFLVTSTTASVSMNVGSSALAASTAYNLNVQCTG